MAKNHVESFICTGTAYELECDINKYCGDCGFEPVSMSVIWAVDRYIAFVVVRGCD